MAATPAFTVNNNLAPKDEPRVMFVAVPFSASVHSITEDFVLETTGGAIDNIQSMYVDNADNANAVTFLFKVTNQRVIVPANAQGYFAIATQDASFKADCAGSLPVNVHFFNVPMAGHVWSVV